MQATLYGLQDNNNNGVQLKDNITRVLPIFSLDNSWYLDANLHFFGNGYTQTLEPRLFYLYVPYKNQQDIPNFDSYLSIFDFDQLFVENRFSGLDKLGDANQISFGLTTRFLDAYSAEERFSANIGIAYQFQRPQSLFE